MTPGESHALIIVITSTAIIYQESALGRESSLRTASSFILPIQYVEKANPQSTSGASATRMKPRDQSASNPLILQAPKGFNDSTYCEPHTNVFIVMFFNAANAGVQAYLNTCLNAVQRDIDDGHTGVIPNDGWRGPLGRNGLHMIAFSEYDHLMTYGELHSAIHEVISWMSSYGHTFGTGSFTIWDGDNQVGHGEIVGQERSYD